MNFINIGAFFDIDGTLYREGLIKEIFKKLIRYDIIDESMWSSEVKPHYEKYDKRIGNYDNYLIKMADIYASAIKGMNKIQLEFIAKKVVEQKGDKVYVFTRNRINYHKSLGHMTFTISGSPQELVKEMSIKHGFDHYIGSNYLTDDKNIYTGEIVPMWNSKNKLKALLDFSNEYDIDLSKSYAYGDTSGDFSMLKAVGNPTVINGTKELLELLLGNEITKNKINIIVERKDVIYKINKDSLDFK